MQSNGPSSLRILFKFTAMSDLSRVSSISMDLLDHLICTENYLGIPSYAFEIYLVTCITKTLKYVMRCFA